jgi:hypothetical protein
VRVKGGSATDAGPAQHGLGAGGRGARASDGSRRSGPARRARRVVIRGCWDNRRRVQVGANE